MAKNIKVFENDSEVSKHACNFIIESANKAITEIGMFTIGVSGGSAAKYLCTELPQLRTDWSKWRIFFCDERHVSYDDPECTYKYYKDNLMSKVELSDSCVFPDDPALSVEEAASKYEATIRQVFIADAGVPKFDLLLLGMGPDGHTCSLFPGHALLQKTKLVAAISNSPKPPPQRITMTFLQITQDILNANSSAEKSKLVAAISDSPKPPPQRITMTLPLINACRCAMFISCGAGKAEMVQRVLEGSEDPPLPASMVKPMDGQLCWFLDKPAARLLKSAQL